MRGVGFGFLMGALLSFAVPARAELGYRPQPKVEAELVLASPLEVGREFRVTGRVKALTALRRLRVTLEPPAVMRLVAPAQLLRSELGAGESVELNATLKLVQAVDGAELKLAIRFREAALVAADELTVSRTLFLSADEKDGGEGLPGSFWRRYTPAPAKGTAGGGFVLEDFGRQPSGRDPSEEARALAGYQSALDALEGGKARSAVETLEALAREGAPSLRAPVSNALAAALALAGEGAAALTLWQGLLKAEPAGSRPRAYLEYNLALLAWSRGEKQAARRHLEDALVGHPGFRQARRVLDGWAFGR